MLTAGFQLVPIEKGGKTIFLDVIVIDANHCPGEWKKTGSFPLGVCAPIGMQVPTLFVCLEWCACPNISMKMSGIGLYASQHCLDCVCEWLNAQSSCELSSMLTCMYFGFSGCLHASFDFSYDEVKTS